MAWQRIKPFPGINDIHWSSRNGGVKTSEIPLLLKHNEDMSKIVSINFFRTLETDPRLAAIQGVFIQRKTNESRESGVCPCPALPSRCLAPHSLESQEAANVVEPTARQPVDGSHRLELLRSFIPRTLSYLTCLGVPWPLRLHGLLA